MIKGTKLKTDDSITFIYLGIFPKMKRGSLNIIALDIKSLEKKANNLLYHIFIYKMILLYYKQMFYI